MDMVYFEKPLFIIFPIILLVWQLFVYCLKKKIKISPFADTWLTGIGVVGHAVAIFVMLINGGTFSDALLLVLLSGVFSLFLSPKANAAENKTDEEENN